MEKAIDKGIEIDSNYRLGQVYNYINQDKASQIFVYEGVQFWREDFQFVFSFKEKRFVGGDIVPFEEFLEMLREQKK